MNMEEVDLYREYGRERDGAAGGVLTGYWIETPAEVSGHRLRPAILILPGGGYHHTSPREGEHLALHFVTRGYAAFVLRYSCAPSAFPVALREAAMAMDYIRTHAHRLEVDPHQVAAMGFSAGGHLCGTLGTRYDSPEVMELGLTQPVRPNALALCYPVAVAWGKTHQESFRNISGGDPELAQRLSLDRLVRKDMPPVFLWHTRDDASVPCRNALLLACALEEAGVDFALHLYRHGRHGLSTADEMAFPTYSRPDISGDVGSWLEALAGFFREVGLTIQDREPSESGGT